MSILDGGSFDVKSVVGIDKGRRKAKGMVMIEAGQPSVVSERDDATALANNILAGVAAAERDEKAAQALIDSGEMNLDEIPNGQGIG